MLVQGLMNTPRTSLAPVLQFDHKHEKTKLSGGKFCGPTSIGLACELNVQVECTKRGHVLKYIPISV